MMDRRKFMLRSLGASLGLGLGASATSPAWLTRRLIAGGIPPTRKMVTIFLRGGNDSVNTVIPRGDAEYSLANRPSLFIPESSAIDLGNGFAQLNPGLEPLMEIYNHSSLNGVAGPGQLAIIQRVGYQNLTRSHFSGQLFWETGKPGEEAFREGMLYRKLAANLDLGNAPLVAAAVDSSLPMAYQGDIPVPAFPRSTDYAFPGSQAELDRFLGMLPSTTGGADGDGFYGLYGGPEDDSTKPYRSLLHATGVQLGQSIDVVQAALQQGAYVPANGAVYPTGTLGDRLAETAMLLKRTPVRILGLNHSGFDTHTNQSADHPTLLAQLAEGLRALSRDLADQWEDVLVVVMSEFGRTSRENGSGGTDHGSAGTMLITGGSVVGGVYNCDATSWTTGDLFSDNSRYVAHRTDFRAVFGEIFQSYFGDDPALIEQIIPGYSQAAAVDPVGFTPLGLFA